MDATKYLCSKTLVDAPKQPLQSSYEGPFAVISRNNKTFVINRRGHHVTISIDRLKPAYVLADNIEPPPEFEDDSTRLIVQRTHRPANNNVDIAPEPVGPQAPPPNNNLRTRSGRRIRFPDYYQAGLN